MVVDCPVDFLLAGLPARPISSFTGKAGFAIPLLLFDFAVPTFSEETAEESTVGAGVCTGTFSARFTGFPFSSATADVKGSPDL